jgi:hypothetical protein
MRHLWSRSALASVLALSACGDNRAAPDGRVDGAKVYNDAPVDAIDPNNPPTLFDTGLCVDRACTQISSDVHPYTPQFPLWADTASKRRWYQLPPGTQIDTTDMDHWVFPVGTKFWKEFSRDDGTGNEIRVETRFIKRIGPGDTALDWFYVAYQWNATETDTMAVPLGVMNANGTQHDIPSRTQCKGCHENLKPSRILGFQAIQLDRQPANAGETTLASLAAAGTLTTNPPAGTPAFPFGGTADVNAALGYVHANCGHCHNPTSGVHGIVNLELRLTVASVGTPSSTPAYMTAVNQTAQIPVGGFTKIIDPHSPGTSTMIYRFEYPVGDSTHMPALGSEMMDPTGDTTLRTWITNLP